MATCGRRLHTITLTPREVSAVSLAQWTCYYNLVTGCWCNRCSSAWMNGLLVTLHLCDFNSFRQYVILLKRQRCIFDLISSLCCVGGVGKCFLTSEQRSVARGYVFGMWADGTVLEPAASSWWKRRLKAGDEIRITERFNKRILFSPGIPWPEPLKCLSKYYHLWATSKTIKINECG